MSDDPVHTGRTSDERANASQYDIGYDAGYEMAVNDGAVRLNAAETERDALAEQVARLEAQPSICLASQDSAGVPFDTVRILASDPDAVTAVEAVIEERGQLRERVAKLEARMRDIRGHFGDDIVDAIPPLAAVTPVSVEE